MTLKIRMQVKLPLEPVTELCTMIDKPHLVLRHNEPHIFTLDSHTGRVKGLRICFRSNSV